MIVPISEIACDPPHFTRGRTSVTGTIVPVGGEVVGDTMARIAAAVRDRRRALELTQQDVADLAGVSERFVRFVEQGKPSVRLDALAAVLDALGLALDAVPSQKMSHKAMP